MLTRLRRLNCQLGYEGYINHSIDGCHGVLLYDGGDGNILANGIDMEELQLYCIIEEVTPQQNIFLHRLC